MQNDFLDILIAFVIQWIFMGSLSGIESSQPVTVTFFIAIANCQTSEKNLLYTYVNLHDAAHNEILKNVIEFDVSTWLVL